MQDLNCTILLQLLRIFAVVLLILLQSGKQYALRHQTERRTEYSLLACTFLLNIVCILRRERK